MIADPLHEILVLFVLLAGYVLLGAVVWFIFCSGNNAAVRRLNAAIAKRSGPVYCPQPGRAGDDVCGPSPDLNATLIALVAEKRLTRKLADRLRKIAPVFHEGKWSVYPSKDYWTQRFERLTR